MSIVGQSLGRSMTKSGIFSRRPLLRVILAGLIALAVSGTAALPATAAENATAASAGPEQPAEVRQILELLSKPAVQSWLKQQEKQAPAAAATASAEQSLIGYAESRATAIRGHFAALAAALPVLPSELERAAGSLEAELAGRGPITIVLLFCAFLAVGIGAEWLFLRSTASVRQWIQGFSLESAGQRLTVAGMRLALGVGVVIAFGVGSIGAFLAFDWPPELRGFVLGYLMALLALRIGLAVGDFLLAPKRRGWADPEKYRILPMETAQAEFWYRRLGLFIGWFAFGLASVDLLGLLGIDPDVRHLVAYALGLGLLAIGLESVWRRPEPGTGAAEQPKSVRRLQVWGVSAFLVLLWLLWVASAMPSFWLLVIGAAVPWTMAGSKKAVARLLQSDPAAKTQSLGPALYAICLHRGLRAAIVIGGALLLARAWSIDLGSLTSGDSVWTRLMRGLISVVVIGLLADLGWQLLKTAIDFKIAEAPRTTDQDSPEWRRHTRMRTLLPIFRNFLFVLVLIIAALMGLASLGIEIGPLIAGASVVGVAIGFGAQTLVRDVISGMFYLLDDAFRVGEYIQSGNYKGTVESFSLRSVKLRHHRGPLYTVPFGVLGAVENMSRDWVIDKLAVGVTYDTDLAKVKKIVKEIGKELKADPEFAPKIMEPLKMQGVEQFGDFAIQIRMKMMTRPGENFAIRRKANAMLKAAFDANGIKFAFPTVQVAGGAETAAAAASAQQVLNKAAHAAD